MCFGVTSDHNEHTCLCLLRSLCLPPPSVRAMWNERFECEFTPCYSLMYEFPDIRGSFCLAHRIDVGSSRYIRSFRLSNQVQLYTRNHTIRAYNLYRVSVAGNHKRACVTCRSSFSAPRSAERGWNFLQRKQRKKRTHKSVCVAHYTRYRVRDWTNDSFLTWNSENIVPSRNYLSRPTSVRATDDPAMSRQLLERNRTFYTT